MLQFFFVSRGTVTSTVLNDSFTDTNGVNLASHTGEVGATWTKTANASYPENIAIQSNRALASGGGGALYTASGVPTQDQYDITVGLEVLAATGASHGVVWRYDPVADSGYLVRYNGGSINIFRLDSGSATDLGSYSVALANGTHTLKIEERSGGVKRVYLNGSQILSATDSAITATGKIGFRLFGFDVAVEYITATEEVLEPESGESEPEPQSITGLRWGGFRYGGAVYSGPTPGGIVSVANESLNLTEARQSYRDRWREVAELLALGDSAQAGRDRIRTGADTLNLADVEQALRDRVRQVAEVLGLGDTETSLLGRTRSMLDTNAISDTESRLRDRLRIWSDTESLPESAVRVRGLVVIRADAAQLQELVGSVSGIIRSVGDVLHLGDEVEYELWQLRYPGLVQVAGGRYSSDGKSTSHGVEIAGSVYGWQAYLDGAYSVKPTE